MRPIGEIKTYMHPAYVYAFSDVSHQRVGEGVSRGRKLAVYEGLIANTDGQTAPLPC